MYFTAKQDFYSEETRSQYVAGLGYTAGDNDSVLHNLLLHWQEEGKIVLGGDGSEIAIVTGRGG